MEPDKKKPEWHVKNSDVERKRNPFGNVSDGVKRGSAWNLADLVGGFGWKATGLLIVLLIVLYVGISLLRSLN